VLEPTAQIRRPQRRPWLCSKQRMMPVAAKSQAAPSWCSHVGHWRHPAHDFHRHFRKRARPTLSVKRLLQHCQLCRGNGLRIESLIA
jgi:hypothetical protein